MGNLEKIYRIFAIIGVVVAIIGGGGLLGWYKDWFKTNNHQEVKEIIPPMTVSSPVTVSSNENVTKTIPTLKEQSTKQEEPRVVEPAKREPIFPKKCDIEAGVVGIAASAKECIEIGNTYRLEISSEKFADFKVVIPEDGNLTFSFETFAEKTWLAIFNKSGKSFDPSKSEIVDGRRGPSTIDRGMKISFNRGDKFVSCGWNVTGQTFTGNYTYTLDAGTYYVRIFRGLQGLSKAHLSVEFKKQ